MYVWKDQPSTTAFWHWFETNHARLNRLAVSAEDSTMDELSPVLEEMTSAIHAYDERLFVTCGTDEHGTPELMVSAEGDPDAMEQARVVVAAAPKIKGWRFTALQPRRKLPETVELPCGLALDTREMVFVMEAHGGLVEIAVGFTGWAAEHADEFEIAAQVLAETALGEADFALKVSGVMAVSLADLADEQDPWPMCALADQFDALLRKAG